MCGILSGDLPPLAAPGDPARMAAAVIASPGRPEAPVRLTPAPAQTTLNRFRYMFRNYS
jgi:hypothetical protein